METLEARTAYRRAYSAYRRSNGPRARWDRREPLSRSGRNGAYFAPVNLDWQDCLRALNAGGLMRLANDFRFPARLPQSRPLSSLVLHEGTFRVVEQYRALR